VVELYGGFRYAHVSTAETKLLPQDDAMWHRGAIDGHHLRGNYRYIHIIREIKKIDQ
jgi:hypothetical protein